MTLLELKLENPIGQDEIIFLRSNLIKAEKHDFLIIDTGEHDFESIATIKFFRDQLMDLEPCLTKFKKIAIIALPQYQSKSSAPHKYGHFSSKAEAVQWFSG